jgi:DNA-binding transcriptional MerR regulator/methylmalonyl-CoA mutase cobalamin-binding subunit
MRVVMRRTGLSADVLRAWENRYQAVSPGRSDGGQRLYTDEDLDRLALLTRATALGRNIGQIARLRSDELRTLLMAEESALEASSASRDDGAADQVRADAMDLVESLDGPELEKVLRRGALQLGLDPFIERVIVPLLRDIDDRCQQAEITPAHERFAGCITGQVLHWIRGTSSEAPGAPRITLATTEGERHELGIQIVAAVAASLGWRVVYLGSDLPPDAIVQATAQSEAQVLTLSFVSADAARNALEPLRTIRDGLSPSVALVAGGSGAAEIQSDLAARGITVMPGLRELRAFLRSFR